MDNFLPFKEKRALGVLFCIRVFFVFLFFVHSVFTFFRLSVPCGSQAAVPDSMSVFQKSGAAAVETRRDFLEARVLLLFFYFTNKN